MHSSPGPSVGTNTRQEGPLGPVGFRIEVCWLRAWVEVLGLRVAGRALKGRGNVDVGLSICFPAKKKKVSPKP